MKKTLPFIIIFAIFLVVVPLIVKADCPPCPPGIICIPDPLKCKGITGVLDAITDLFKIIVIPLGTIMIIIGGVQIMTGMATGEKEKRVLTGKKTLKWAIIGIAIVLAVDFIVGLVTEILGLE